MIRFLLVRTGVLAIGLALASLLIFATLRLLPGDAALVIGGVSASPERIEQLRQMLGLDRPLPVQYLEWVGGIGRLDLGDSLVTGVSVGGELVEKAQVTVPLTLLALLIGLLIAVPLGVFTAYRRQNPVSQAVAAGSVIAASLPAVWAGLLAIIVFSTWLGWFPSQGFPRSGWEHPLLALRSLALPAFTIGLIEGAILFRFVRSATIDAMRAEHVRTAMAQGSTRLRALLAHGLPGVGLSIVSMLGLQTAALLVGAVVIEQLFSLPGLGSMLVSDVGNRDLPKVQSTLFVLTGAILVIGAVVDVTHRLIDPRMRTSGES